MDYYEFLIKIAETQGITSLLLLLVLMHQFFMQQALMTKICVLETFIMKCLSDELLQEHVHQGKPKP